jgi:hypothetical protein
LQVLVEIFYQYKLVFHQIHSFLTMVTCVPNALSYEMIKA